MRTSLFACLLVLAGCSNAAPGAADFTCPSERGPVGATIDAPHVDVCRLDATGTLTMTSSHVPTSASDQRGDFVEISIEGFTGAGTYTTSAGGTLVSLRGSHEEGTELVSTDIGSEPIGTCEAQACTIVVTGATPTAEASSALTFEITCGTLNTQTPNCVICDVNTAPIVVEAGTCEAG